MNELLGHAVLAPDELRSDRPEVHGDGNQQKVVLSGEYKQKKLTYISKQSP